VSLPEELWDHDGPGHYFRRLRSVALSLPSVGGPYTSVNCTLTLLSSSIRTSPSLGDAGYARDGEDAQRFSDSFGGVQSVVTSTGHQDSGLFEPAGRDERYLPFEGSGAVSRWRLELAAELPQFPRTTISDVILHVRYTAREGGAGLRRAAVANLRERMAAAGTTGSVRLLSMRQEFPTEWARFTARTVDGAQPLAPLTFTLREEHYPYWARAFAPIALRGVELNASPTGRTGPTVTVYDKVTDDPPGSRHASPLTTDDALGGLRRGELADPLPAAIGEVTLYLDDNSLSDLWVALAWGEPE
jgi:hypothetical protein